MTATTTRQIVSFRLGSELFAAEIASVERVLRYTEPRLVPGMPDWIEGVLDYRSRVVPVIDMRRRFEVPVVAAGNSTRLLVFNAGGEWIAGVVDEVLDVTTVTDQNFAAPPAIFRGLSSEFLRGVARRGEKLVIVLDVERIFSTNERLSLEQFAARGPQLDSVGESLTAGE